MCFATLKRNTFSLYLYVAGIGAPLYKNCKPSALIEGFVEPVVKAVVP
jgi:hypothetical protein